MAWRGPRVCIRTLMVACIVSGVLAYGIVWVVKERRSRQRIRAAEFHSEQEQQLKSRAECAGAVRRAPSHRDSND